MCGICGFVLIREPDFDCPSTLRKMNAELVHRGPDDQGYFEQTPAYLGQRRLEVVDIKGGKQPMTNEDGSVVVVFNGEIYNQNHLRTELIEKGHRFRTRSDTEVLVHLWEEVGPDLPSRLNGMFAFAIWDSVRSSLFLARDRFGQKPLYYRESPGGFVFASELTSLMQHPWTSRQIDPVALQRYLLFDCIPPSRTMLEGSCKLDPGCSLLVKQEKLSIQRYWDISFPDSTTPQPSFAEACDRFRELMTASIERRLMADVPLGVFLSGGIDSSTLVALLSNLSRAGRINTYCIGFSEQSFDESAYARQIAKQFGTHHHERILDADSMAQLLPEIIAKLDEPLADSSLLPTYLLSKFAREQLVVALGGDGGDELCLGYPTFHAHRVAALFARLPGPLRRAVSAAVNRLPVSTGNWSLDYQAKRFILGMDYDRFSRHFVWIAGTPPKEQEQLLTHDYRPRYTEEVLAPVLEGIQQSNPRDDFDLLTYVYSKLYLSADILVKVDRASMMNSLEVRAPFLDPGVAEFMISLPASYKLKLGEKKRLITAAMRPELGREIGRRRKKGFGMPIAAWLKGPLKQWAEDLLFDTSSPHHSVFDARVVRTLWTEHMEGTKDNRKTLWSLLVFLLWARTNRVDL